MFDFEDKVLDHTLSHVNLSVDEQTEGDEVGVPIVELNRGQLGHIKSTARHTSLKRAPGTINGIPFNVFPP